jgi:hypothetical protein
MMASHDDQVAWVSMFGQCDQSHPEDASWKYTGGQQHPVPSHCASAAQLILTAADLCCSQDLLQRGVFSHGSLSGPAHLCWVLATAKEFCTAVSYLHSMDVVHGDLKSSNVLLKAAAATAWDSRGFVAKVSRLGSR